MARRLFFVDEIHSGQAEIRGDDAGHLTRVLRVEKGQRYEISDNRDLYLAEVELARREHVVFRLIEKLEATPAAAQLHLLAALIKFDHFEWTLEKAAELGVERITPVMTVRSEHGLDRAAQKRAERWRRILREASQQCRRVRLPELDPVRPLAKSVDVAGLRLMLDEERSAEPLLGALPARWDEAALLVGPEGGWTSDERVFLRDSGWRAVSLGPTVLRAETAAVAGLAVLVAARLAPGS